MSLREIAPSCTVYVIFERDYSLRTAGLCALLVPTLSDVPELTVQIGSGEPANAQAVHHPTAAAGVSCPTTVLILLTGPCTPGGGDHSSSAWNATPQPDPQACTAWFRVRPPLSSSLLDVPVGILSN